MCRYFGVNKCLSVCVSEYVAECCMCEYLFIKEKSLDLLSIRLQNRDQIEWCQTACECTQVHLSHCFSSVWQSNYIAKVCTYLTSKSSQVKYSFIV